MQTFRCLSLRSVEMDTPTSGPKSCEKLSSHVYNQVRENVNFLKFPPQSFSLKCSYSSENELTAILNAVKLDNDMIFYV